MADWNTMRRLFAITLLMTASGPFIGGQQPPLTDPSKLQALIITGQNGHNWRATTPVLRQVLEDSGRFEVRVTEEFRGAGAESLAPYDLAIVNYFERGRPEWRWGPRTDQALADFVRSGKGLVIYHFAVASFDGWTDYEKMAAGMWVPAKGYGHHSARHDFVVDVKDADHPITRGLRKSFPQPNDELYANLRWQPSGSFHVLATAWDDHELYKASRTDAKAPQALEGSGLHQPILWTVEFGKGRVFTTVLGHDVETIQTPAFVGTFLRGAEWAATGKVTLPVPAALTP
jgi:type 1 glutamine amidotransferase